ncbi:glutaredoxin-like protein [Halovivax ruber XH-70]|uniref:Glutaredoxin-like protein n=1 Tax=Halovivax ruber (strain DSM 18193 / JCM 13892 / XH-70) TaxID=797302 RepID=L0IF66_HALRX|nr:glutaredoxin [Halovivax ruber]AGB16622.1 glutaredoxin-like protein [Halovivax ruber XH-70]
MADITYYELPGCPFCAMVRTKLDELGLDYETIEVPAAHHERTRVQEVSGQTGVPVITDEAHDVVGMPESSDIVAYLEETYGDA